MLLALYLLTQAPIPTVTPARDGAFRHPDGLELTNVFILARAPHEDLLLIDRTAAVVVHLDSTGALLPPLARHGAGPGEVRSAQALGWRGDTLWVADGALRRITYFSPALRLLGTQSDFERCGFVPWTIGPDGRCIVLPQPAVPPDQPVPTTLPLLLSRPHGPTDTLGQVAMARMVIRYKDMDNHVPQPFADDPIPVFSRDGRYFSWVGQRPLSSTGRHEVSVQTWNLSTGARRTFRVPYAPLPLSPDTVAKVIAQYRHMKAHFPPGFVDSVTRRLYRPEFLPAFARALIDEAGRLWLEEQPTEASGLATWHVLDVDGRPRCNVRLPTAFQLLAVGPTRLVGTMADADDVPVLAAWRLPPHAGCDAA